MSIRYLLKPQNILRNREFLFHRYPSIALAFQALGVDSRIGTLDFDTTADFIMIEEDKMEIMSTWMAGKCVWEQTSSNSSLQTLQE